MERATGEVLCFARATGKHGNAGTETGTGTGTGRDAQNGSQYF